MNPDNTSTLEERFRKEFPKLWLSLREGQSPKGWANVTTDVLSFIQKEVQDATRDAYSLLSKRNETLQMAHETGRQEERQALIKKVEGRMKTCKEEIAKSEDGVASKVWKMLYDNYESLITSLNNE